MSLVIILDLQLEAIQVCTLGGVDIQWLLEPYKTTVQPQSRLVFGWIQGKGNQFWLFLPSKKKKKKKVKLFLEEDNIIWNLYVWHSIKYY